MRGFSAEVGGCCRFSVGAGDVSARERLCKAVGSAVLFGTLRGCSEGPSVTEPGLLGSFLPRGANLSRASTRFLFFLPYFRMMVWRCRGPGLDLAALALGVEGPDPPPAEDLPTWEDGRTFEALGSAGTSEVALLAET